MLSPVDKGRIRVVMMVMSHPKGWGRKNPNAKLICNKIKMYSRKPSRVF